MSEEGLDFAHLVHSVNHNSTWKTLFLEISQVSSIFGTAAVDSVY
jgi:hypothetical protein